MIVNIRGTHGSGKSTLARKILDKYPHGRDFAEDKPAKTLGYAVDLPTGKCLYVVGSYATPCGGADAIQPFAAIWPRVAAAAERYDHVLFEGALVSTTFGSIGEAAALYGEGFTYAFLDTPLDVCIARVNERRAAAGKGPIADTKNIESKWRTIRRLRGKIALGEVACGVNQLAVLRHERATRDLMALFDIKINKELA